MSDVGRVPSPWILLVLNLPGLLMAFACYVGIDHVRSSSTIAVLTSVGWILLGCLLLIVVSTLSARSIVPVYAWVAYTSVVQGFTLPFFGTCHDALVTAAQTNVSINYVLNFGNTIGYLIAAGWTVGLQFQSDLQPLGRSLSVESVALGAIDAVLLLVASVLTFFHLQTYHRYR